MKRKGSKVLSIALSACMLLGLLPGIALAGTTAMATAVIIEGITLSSSAPYWKNGADSATADASGYNAYFDSGTGTLTLKNAVITAKTEVLYSNKGIASPANGSLNIVLEGSNIINELNCNDGIYIANSAATLTISGSGTLTTTGSNCGIFSNGPVVINGGTIIASGETNGIAGSTISISSGSVTAKSNGRALSADPTLGENISAVVSANMDGTAAIAYAYKKNENKYFRSGASVMAVGDIYFPDCAIGWNTAVAGGMASTGGISVSVAPIVRLLADWTADSGTKSFGTGAGFGASGNGSGCIFVPKDSTISLDLRGHKIDRSLDTATADGFVIKNCGKLTISDSSKTAGSIQGGFNTESGGGIYNCGELDLTECSISQNNTNTYGGGVYNAENDAAVFTMTSGRISGNTSENGLGGGVYNAGHFTVGGTACVTGNHAGVTTDNVYLPEGKTISCSITLPLNDSASIGVTTSVQPTDGKKVAITYDDKTEDYSGYFTSDKGYAVAYNQTDPSNCCVELVYGVTFKAAGGYFEDGARVKGVPISGGKVDIPKVSWKNYSFVGWFSGTDGSLWTESNGGSIADNSQLTVYAMWRNAAGNYVDPYTLDLTSVSDVSNEAEGWAWYADAHTINGTAYPAKTLILNGATIDTTEEYGIVLPDGATIVPMNGTTNAVYSAGEDESKAIYCGPATDNGTGLTIDGGGTLAATAYSDNNAEGICAEGPIVIKNGTVNAVGGNTTASSAGIFSSSDITIIGGRVTAVGGSVSGTGGYSEGIVGLLGVSVKGGSVSASGSSTESVTKNSIGIMSGLSASFTGGTTSAKGELAAIFVASENGFVMTGVSILSPANAVVGKFTEIEGTCTVLSGDTTATEVTIGTPYIGGGSTTSSTTSTVVVGGKTTDAGKVTTTTNTDGTKNATVVIDSAKLSAQLAAADTGSSVVVTVPTSTGTASTQLVVKDVENLSAKDMPLEIKTAGTTYTVAPNAIDTAKVAAELGASDTSKVPLTVTVTSVKQSNVTVARGEQVTDPVRFEVMASYDGKTVSVSSFKLYVERMVTIPAGVDPKMVTTGIRVDDSEQVPTNVTKNADGTCTAKINSLTNSTYAIIYNEASFADTVGKWYNDIVTEMASRTIVTGKTATTFDGDGYITRAEYAAILVRALGIPESGTSSFSDVASADWYYGAVSAAVKYGIITGYNDGTFKPNANISRQEAMAMLQRAAKVAAYAGTTGTLSGFSDAGQVSAWAEAAAAFNVGSGLIVGDSGALRPNDSITRAEAATVVLRLLQKAGLVDVRTRT